MTADLCSLERDCIDIPARVNRSEQSRVSSRIPVEQCYRAVFCYLYYMARPKKKVRFKIIKVSRSYWMLYDRDRIRGYISRGGGYNVYFADTNHKWLGAGFTSMRKATEIFQAQLSAE